MQITHLKLYQAVYVGKDMVSHVSTAPSNDRSQPLAGNCILDMVPGIGVAITNKTSGVTSIVTFNNIAYMTVVGFKAEVDAPKLKSAKG